MNRRLPVTVTLLAFVALLFTTQADAQDRRRGMRGGYDRSSPMRLLGYEAVQKDLKLSEDKIKAVSDLQQEMRDSYSSGFDREKFGQMSEDERREAFAKMRAEREKVSKEYEKKLVSVVGEDTMTRVREIGVQQQGGSAVRNAEVAKALELTEEQTKQIEDISTASREKMRALFQGGQRDREAFSKLTAETNEKYLAVLTDDQKKKLEKMKGKPFDISQLRRQRRQEV